MNNLAEIFQKGPVSPVNFSRISSKSTLIGADLFPDLCADSSLIFNWVDTLGPLPSGEYLLVIIDDYSRFPVVEVLQNLTCDIIIKKMHYVFCTYGLPEQMKTDNARYFIAQEMKTYLNQHGIDHVKITPYHP